MVRFEAVASHVELAGNWRVSRGKFSQAAGEMEVVQWKISNFDPIKIPEDLLT